MQNSSSNLATIVRISGISPIPDADKIVKATMEDNAWQVVVPKDSFNVGDLGVYFVIDSLVDSTNPALAFMAARKNIVWPVRLKKQLSQGLLIPISSLAYWGIDPISVKQGDDVTDLTKTTKRLREEDAPSNPAAAGSFPSHVISQTDELNLLSFKAVFAALQGKKVTITLKMDGSSSTFLNLDGAFTACSRRLKLKPDAENGWNRLAAKYDLRTLLSVYTANVIQGEVVGPKFNGNRLGLTEEDLYVFDIFNTVTRSYRSYDEMKAFCDQFGLKTVPLVWQGIFNFNSIDELVQLASEQKYQNGKPAEGIVIRADSGEWSDDLGKRLSVKVINPDYKAE